MICLGIDCAGPVAGVALAQDDQILYACKCSTGATHSQALLPMVADALQATHLSIDKVDLFGVTAGPGSFTGLRIGISLVKGLALPHNTPCAAVSTLEALAACHVGEGTVLPALDARRGQVYWAAFNLADGQRLAEDAAGAVEELQNFIQSCKKPLYFVGDGAELCYNSYGNVPGVLPCPPFLRTGCAAGVCQVALRMQAVFPAELLPRYHRLSQAERERAARLAENKTISQEVHNNDV